MIAAGKENEAVNATEEERFRKYTGIKYEASVKQGG